MHRFSFFRFLLLTSAFLLPTSLPASLCVWRFPDRDLKELFRATSYQTIFVDIPADKEKRIEARLGQPLDPDETQFKFFPVFRSGKRVGTVVTHLGKGQYGAIEVVVALSPDPGGKIVVKAVRIQRDREKASAALRSARFLDQFAGRTVADRLVVGKDVKTAAPGVERSSQAVATAVRKALVAYDELMEDR